MSTAEHLLEFHLNVEGTAEWRRGKTVEFPQDERNQAAAEELEQIASEIRALEGSEYLQQMLDQIEEAHETLGNLTKSAKHSGAHVGDPVHDLIEAVSEELRHVGFHTSHSGKSLLEWYRDVLRDKVQDCLDGIVPTPDLAEQVEDNPEVKVAKQAYEQARAKAYAEARKRL
jgi:hypothetical protein